MPLADLEKRKEYNRGYYEKHREQLLAKQKEYNRIHQETILRRRKEYCQNHRKELRAKGREYYRRHQEQVRSYQAKYIQKNPGKILAEARAFYWTDLDGTCKNCGSTESLERHHPDYSKPLDVVTLCRSCHFTLHRS